MTAARHRLDPLDTFLREDPANTALRIDAFESALSCREWERAHRHLQSGLASDADPWGWKLREGDFWLARQRFDEARGVLEALAANAAAAPAGFERVVSHNLAYLDMRQGRLTACIDRLAPLLEAPSTTPQVAGPVGIDAPVTSTAERALQQLWLRALHHHGELARAVAWATAAEQSRQLDPQAAGTASLIALDAADVVAARRWSAACLTHSTGQDRPTEALATQASLALAERDAQRARHFADQALALSPLDGRAWSTRAFADMLAGSLGTARTAFQQAVTSMPTHIGTWHGKGWAELMLGDLAAAQASFEAALALDRNFAESHGGLAVVLAMQQQADAAQAHAERARRIDPANLSGRYAEALLSGDVKAGADMQRLARRLLGERTGLLGEAMRGWLP